MQEPQIRRVDLAALAGRDDGGEQVAADGRTLSTIRWWVPPTCVVLAVAQSLLWIAANDIRHTAMAGSLIPVMGFALLLIIVVLLNPLLGLLRRVLWVPRPLCRAELVTVFATMLVTAGISTFGLTEQLVPIIATPFDPSLNTAQRGWSALLLPHLNHDLYLTDPKLIEQFRNGLQMQPAPDATWWDRMAVHWQAATMVPWTAWLRPLGYWMIFVAAVYGLFYSLAYVVLPLWSDREKLIFPLAKLPESLLPESDAQAHRVPAIFRNVGFWLAFGIVFAILSWNATLGQQWIAGANPVRLGMARWDVDALLINSWVFSPLRGSVGLLIMFTAIGIAFLLPVEMSFSVWFYYVASRLLLLMVCWMGFGASGFDFPSDIWSNANFISTQGAGGMFVFAAISLARCVMEYRRLAANASRSGRVRILLPLIGMVVSLVVLLLWLRWNSVPLLLGVFILVVITLMTVGMMRIVAESGVYWLQAHTGVFHLHKMLGLGSLIHGSIIAPLLPIYCVFFLDLKSFIAPNLVNAAKLQEDDARRSRLRFHLTILTSIVASVVSSLLFAIYLGYRRGAKSMHEWFYTTYPQLVFDNARNMTGRGGSISFGLTTWFILGGGWVALSLYLRRTVFWFPHPLGYIMLINPLMNELWLSFFIAWFFKRMVVKYGGKTTYDHVRSLAIGMIVGELVAIALWTCIALYTGRALPNISLNRYAA